MSHVPKVSVIVLLYNEEKYLKECLDSILGQQCDFRFEILVADDASQDGSKDILLGYADKYPGIVVPVLNETNLGVVGNLWNAGSRVRGEYVAFCDSDDYWIDPHKLKKQVQLLDEDNDIVLVYTNAKVLDEETGEFRRNVTRPMPEGYVFDHLLEGNFIKTLTVCVRSGLFGQALDAIVPSGEWSVQDYPLWLFMAKRGAFRHLDDVTAVYRLRSESVSRSRDRARKVAYKYGVWKIREHFMEDHGNLPGETEMALRAEGADLTVLHLFYSGQYGRLRAFLKEKRGRAFGRRANRVARCASSNLLLGVLSRMMR